LNVCSVNHNGCTKHTNLSKVVHPTTTTPNATAQTAQLFIASI